MIYPPSSLLCAFALLLSSHCPLPSLLASDLRYPNQSPPPPGTSAEYVDRRFESVSTQMREGGLRPTASTYKCACEAYIKLGFAEQAMQVGSSRGTQSSSYSFPYSLSRSTVALTLAVRVLVVL